jgi:hypothetical protein
VNQNNLRGIPTSRSHVIIEGLELGYRLVRKK